MREPTFNIYASDPPPDIDGLLSPELTHALHLQTLTPKLSIIPRFADFASEGAWLVRLSGIHAGRPAYRPVYFPYVATPETLRDTLERAWNDPDSKAGALMLLRPRLTRTHEDGHTDS